VSTPDASDISSINGGSAFSEHSKMIAANACGSGRSFFIAKGWQAEEYRPIAAFVDTFP